MLKILRSLSFLVSPRCIALWAICATTCFCALVGIAQNQRQSTKADQIQPIKKAFPFDAIGLEQGLSQGMINHILQDKNGFMWFATKDGLNRFDGYQFVVFKHKPGDSTSLADNYVTTVFEDSRGFIWVGTSGKGLDLFDPWTETFSHFRHDEKNKNSLSNNTIYTIVEDKRGTIWVGTNFGLNKITLKSRNTKSVKSSPKFRYQFLFEKVILDSAKPQVEYFTKQPTTDYELLNLHADNEGHVWVSCAGILFHILPGGINQPDKINLLPVKDYFWFPFEDHGMERHAHAFVEDKANHKLYLISSFSIAEVDTRTMKVRWVSQKRFIFGDVKNMAVVDRSGYLWFCESDKLIRLNLQTSEAEEIIDQNTAIQNEILFNTVYADRSGVLWVGSKGLGLFKLNVFASKFHNHPIGSVKYMTPLNDSVVVILNSSNEILVFNTKTERFLPSIPDEKARKSIPDYKYGIIDAVLPDSDGSIWITKSRLLKYLPQQNEIKEFRGKDKIYFPLFKDKENNIWLGTDKAFNKVNKSTMSLEQIPFPFTVWNYPYTFIQCIFQDEEKTFWLGTNAGLLQLDASAKKWKQYKNDPKNQASLGFDLIFCIVPDPDEPQTYLWIGTNGGGLNRFNKKTLVFERFTTEQGLPNDVVYGILPDASGNLWLSTNQGLARFNRKTGEVKGFTKSDGLQGNEFNRYAFCKDGLGKLFFGGINGFNYFNPSTLNGNVFVPKTVITDVRIMNKQPDFKNPSSKLKAPPHLTRKLELDHEDKVLTIDFSAMEYSSGNNRFKYKLQGFDKEYIDNGSKNSVTYTNLDPGKYTFKVLASNSDGIWGEEPGVLRIEILPPWHQTWWFRTFAFVLFFGTVYTIYRYRLQQAIKLQLVRNSIAQDLHDEVGSNLSSISIFSELAANEAREKNPEITRILDRINVFSVNSMEAMSDIVWMIDPKNDKFDNIIFHMRELAVELIEAKNMTLHMLVDEKLNTLRMSMASRKNFWLIFKEALNNTAKYSQAQNVYISLHLAQANILLQIKDDGIGFEMKAKSSGNGLMNMAKRAQALGGTFLLDSTPGKGTTMDLVFSM